MKDAMLATGRRKTSVAQVKLSPGAGKVVINEKPADDYFRGCPRYYGMVQAPITNIEAAKTYDFQVRVEGGGIASQAGAIRHALSRALAKMGDDAKKTLKKAGFLTRDSRMVERKKPGQPKARKRFQYSKR